MSRAIRRIESSSSCCKLRKCLRKRRSTPGAMYTLAPISAAHTVSIQHQWGRAGDTAINGNPRIFGRVYIGTNGPGIFYGDGQ